MVFSLSKIDPSTRHALETKSSLKVSENTLDKKSALEPACYKVSGLWSRTCIYLFIYLFIYDLFTVDNFR